MQYDLKVKAVALGYSTYYKQEGPSIGLRGKTQGLQNDPDYSHTLQRRNGKLGRRHRRLGASRNAFDLWTYIDLIADYTVSVTSTPGLYLLSCNGS